MRSLFLVVAAGCVAVGCGDDDGGGGAGGAGGAAVGGSGGEGGAPLSADELLTPGPFAVGFRQVEVTYTAPASTDSRTLPLSVWYPATDGGEPPATYAVGGIVSVPTDGALAAPMVASSESGAAFPVAVYSHGSGGENLLAYPYGELFASHGWVVVAPNHVGNTALDGLSMTFDSFERIALNRPADITASIDWLEDLTSDPLAGVADTSSVFLFGHSFGAFTTLAGGGTDLDVAALQATCGADCPELSDPDVLAAFEAGFGDARIVAIAPQAPALVPQLGAGELAALSVPTLLMSGRMDKTTTHESQTVPAWEGLDNPDDRWVELPNGGHHSFITICDDLSADVLAVFQPDADEDGCGPAFTPTSEVVPVLAAYLLGFARQHVLGEAGWQEVIDGEPLHPELTVVAH